MFLVVGLAIAGVVGIAAAFYFSIRSGSGGNKRLRSAGAGRADTGRRSGSRSGGTARPDRADDARRSANGSRPANTGQGANASSRNYRAEASTGPNPVLDFGDPVLVGGRRGGPGTSAGDSQATDLRLAAAMPAEDPGRANPGRGAGRRHAFPVRPPRPGASTGQPGRVGAWASARGPTSMKKCGRRSRSAASATSSSGMTWRRTSRSPRPRAPPSRIPGPGTGRSMRCRRARPGHPQPGHPQPGHPQPVAGRAACRHPARPEPHVTGPGRDPARPGRRGREPADERTQPADERRQPTSASQPTTPLPSPPRHAGAAGRAVATMRIR